MSNNPVNCWKAKPKGMPISSQAPKGEGSETIRVDGVHAKWCGSAGHPEKDDDIVRSSEKSEGSEARVYKIYYLVSRLTSWYYIGITKNKLRTRFNQHKSAAKRGVTSPVYSCMRKYEDFIIVLADDYLTHKEACDKEIELIASAKKNGHRILNLAVGGQTGYVIPEDRKEEWKRKLSEKRKGRKPFLGNEHTEEVKSLCTKAAKNYWESQDTYDPVEVTSIPFKESAKKYGISRTHYYRLKRALRNEQC